MTSLFFADKSLISLKLKDKYSYYNTATPEYKDPKFKGNGKNQNTDSKGGESQAQKRCHGKMMSSSPSSLKHKITHFIFSLYPLYSQNKKMPQNVGIFIIFMLPFSLPFPDTPARHPFLV
ncbi:hypothetical protein [Alkaliphilus crotonatoxidans]